MELEEFHSVDETNASWSERWRSRFTSRWRRVVKYMNARPDEPFHFLTNGRRLFDYVATIGLIALCCATCYWQVAEGRKRFERMRVLLANPSDPTLAQHCSDFRFARYRPILTAMITTAVGTVALHLIIFLISSLHFRHVIPFRKIHFRGRRNIGIPPKDMPEFPSSLRFLGPVTRKLRQVVQDVREGRAPAHAATHFLLSPEGRSFLHRASTRVHEKLQIYDDEVVRKNRRGTIHFFLVSLICVTTAMAAAYSDSEARDKCGLRIVFLAFLEKVSFTLLAVFAVASFAGLTQYSQLVCVREKLCRLTEDEKFLISLIAANSEVPFHGLTSKGGSAAYAVIGEPGETKAFIPMHSSLFAHKEPRTHGHGPLREYDPEAPLADGDYDMF